MVPTETGKTGKNTGKVREICQSEKVGTLIDVFCERLETQNSISTELEADWQSWWSCKQLPLPINSCYEAALAGFYVF